MSLEVASWLAVSLCGDPRGREQHCRAIVCILGTVANEKVSDDEA